MRKKSFHLFYFLFLNLFLSISALDLQACNPYIMHFNKKQYGGATLTWQMKVHNNGWIFAANEKGLLVYDGYNWQRKRIQSGGQIRSVYVDTLTQRVYVGGVNELGYFYPRKNGELFYKCLSDRLDSKKKHQLDNIWNIFRLNNTMCYIGDTFICLQQGEKKTYIEAPSKITSSAVVRGVLYIGTSSGIYMLSNKKLYILHGTEHFKGHTIRAIIPYQDGALILTTKRIFFYKDQEIKPYLSKLSTYLKEYKTFCATLHNDLLAIGTIQKGVLIYNMKTQAMQVISEVQGLQNNTVLSLAWDKQNRLWAGLDRGIDCIKLKDRLTYLNTYPQSLGTGYCAIAQENLLYLGSNRGLYVINNNLAKCIEKKSVTEIKTLKGQLWEMKKVGDEVFCLHDNGIFVLKDKQIKRVGTTIGAWTMTSFPKDKKHVVVALYKGLVLLERTSRGWIQVGKIKELKENYKSLVADTDSTLWLHQPEKMIRFCIDKKNQKIKKRRTYNFPLSFKSNLHLSLINKELCVTTSIGCYKYDAASDQFIPNEKVNKMFPLMKELYSIQQRKDAIWALGKHSVCKYSLRTKKSKTFYLNTPLSFIEGRERLYWSDDEHLVLPNEQGFAVLNVADGIPSSPEYRKTKIRKVLLSYPSDSVLYHHSFSRKKRRAMIDYRYNSIIVFFGVDDKEEREVRYKLRLLGDQRWNKWSDWTEYSVKDFSNLHEGEYTFQVYSNLDTTVDTYTFKVLPPWYRTNAAYIVYVIFLLIGFVLLVVWDKQRLAKERARTRAEGDEMLAKQQELHEIEQGKKKEQIKQLEHNQLKKELEHKHQEMTNLLIGMAQKNEILSLLKVELKQAMYAAKPGHMTELKQSLLIMNNQIDDSIKNEELLKRLEDEYDLLHNNFMKKLKAEYPDLNKNERLMCIYLSMDLSTKEIAPLLNISIRGAETIRYRLRKKMNFDKNDKLVEYIHSLT